VGASIKLDINYAIIPTFGGEERMCYRESRFVKTMIPAKSYNNFVVYGKESGPSCLFLEEYETILEETHVHLIMLLDNQNIDKKSMEIIL